VIREKPKDFGGCVMYESKEFYIGEKRINVYRVEPAKGVDG